MRLETNIALEFYILKLMEETFQMFHLVNIKCFFEKTFQVFHIRDVIKETTYVLLRIITDYYH